MATPFNEIDGKSHKTELKSSHLLFKVKITPLVIYGLGGVHTHTLVNESETRRVPAPGLKIKRTKYDIVKFKNKFHIANIGSAC